MQEYFDYFGLPTSASIDQIKTAYRRLALRLHPDVNPSPDADAQFTRLNEIYNILLEYRETGRTPFQRSFTPPPPTREEIYVQEALRRKQQREERLVRKLGSSQIYYLLTKHSLRIYGAVLGYLFLMLTVVLLRLPIPPETATVIYKILWVYTPIALVMLLVLMPQYSVNQDIHEKIIAYREKNFSKK